MHACHAHKYVINILNIHANLNITDVRSRGLGVEEGTGKEIGGRRNENARWLSRVTKLDKIRNERIRWTTKVGQITKKVQERRLKWYGHVIRRKEHYLGRRAMEMKVQERRKA